MKQMRILVVEDEPYNVRGTIALLENTGLGVDIASTVSDAADKLRQRPYALILVDWTLPIVPGGASDAEGGGKLIKLIRAGTAGEANANINYFVITKQTDQFSTSQAVPKGQLGVFSKLDALSIIGGVLGAISKPGTDI